MYRKIRSASKGLANRRRQYAKEGPIWLEGKRCQAHWDVLLMETGDSHSQWTGVAPMATQIHHMKGREGHLLLLQEFWCALCGPCHVFIEEHGRWAREHGFSI